MCQSCGSFVLTQKGYITAIIDTDIKIESYVFMLDFSNLNFYILRETVPLQKVILQATGPRF